MPLDARAIDWPFDAWVRLPAIAFMAYVFAAVRRMSVEGLASNGTARLGLAWQRCDASDVEVEQTSAKD